jgi:hypothetical protein
MFEIWMIKNDMETLLLYRQGLTTEFQENIGIIALGRAYKKKLDTRDKYIDK